MSGPNTLGVRRAAAPPAARLTVAEQLYHEAGAGPTQHGHQFSRALAAGAEQAYACTLPVGPDWRPLDLGWLAGAGVAMLLLANQAGAGRQVIPTDAERAAAAAQVVEVAFAAAGTELVAALLVRPGESCRFEPADAAAVRLRCRAGTARCQVTLIPA